MSGNGYDLEQRTETFARRCRRFLKRIPRTESHVEDGRQLIRSSGSIAGNYIEANEALSKKDFKMRIKISRKEAKESGLWLRLLELAEFPELDRERNALNQESIELMKIFGAILRKSE